MNNPLISIIIPSYNSKEHIKNTINSILQQTYDNYELIIQDSLSDDNTINIINSYSDPRIKLFIEKDNGINHAFYNGLIKSKGDYIMFMPFSDEYVENNWFQICINILEKNERISLVHGNDIKKFENGEYTSIRFPEFEKKRMPSGTDFLSYWFATNYHISELNYCVRRKVYFDCMPVYKYYKYDEKYIENGKIGLNVLNSWNSLIMFNYYFIKNGYLPHHEPIIATATLKHKNRKGTTLGEKINHAIRVTYLNMIIRLEKDIISKKISYVFRDGNGQIIKKRMSILNLKLNILRHKIFRANFDFDILPSFNIYNYKKYIKIILKPKRAIMQLSFFKFIRYLKHFIQFNKFNDGRFILSLKNKQIEINDWSNTHDFDHHYVYHTAWASRILYTEKPEKHIDISSDIRFSSLVSTFIKTEYYDIRKLKIELSGLITGVADLVDLPFQSESISSLSCMHVVEHCGLGRYGDVLDPKADLKAINELIRVLKPEGKLYFVVPVASEPRINFNAHRVYSHKQVMDYFSELKLIEFSLIPDDYRDGTLIRNPSSIILNKQKYGCGCYLFTK